MENKNIKIYLASGFFNAEEIGRMEIVRDILRQKGLEVFVPMENQFKELEFGSVEWREKTFNNDIKNIDEADIVVAINSNSYDDSGTMFEIGYAYATNKPVIVFSNTGSVLNLMITDSLHAYLTSYEELYNYDFDKLEKIPYTGEVI